MSRGKGWRYGKSSSQVPRGSGNISSRDLGWCAGFLEGEGSFTRGTKGQSLSIRAGQKTREPLDKLQSLLGGRIRKAHSQNGIYRWTICGARARGVAMTLYSLMSERRKKQIKEGLV